MSDLKLFEDLIALAQTGSFVRAAELRHVTHPAFGRRIRALETWAGAPLVERGRTPVVLTAQGEALLQAAGQVVEQVDRVREQLRSAGRQEERILRIGTGRSLARTLVADWIARLRQRPARLLDGAQVELSTGVMQEMAALLEQGRVDLVCCYEHPALSVQLTPGRFRYMTLGIDKLVPVCQADARGRPRHALSEGGPAAPLITYSGGLAMARIAGDRLETFPMRWRRSCAATPSMPRTAWRRRAGHRLAAVVDGGRGLPARRPGRAGRTGRGNRFRGAPVPAAYPPVGAGRGGLGVHPARPLAVNCQ